MLRGFAAVLLALSCFSCWAETYQGKVVGVSDGDTITVLDGSKIQHKVRLAGIDAPEKNQPYGQASKTHLSNLVFGKLVTIETQKLDRYKREIGMVLSDGKDINLAQIEAGMAWHYKQYQRDQSPADRRLYSDTERVAQLTRKGLWADKSPIPPWEFRKSSGQLKKGF